MFKVGDIVYCIDNNNLCCFINGVKSDSLELDTPYIVNKHYSINLILEGKSVGYLSDRFISEQEYNISKRKDKINKILNV